MIERVCDVEEMSDRFRGIEFDFYSYTNRVNG